MNIKSTDLFSQKIYEIKYKPILIIDHPKNPQNIGSIIRLAANVNAAKVIIIDQAPSFKDQMIKKTAASAYKKVEHIFVEPNAIHEYLPKDYTLVAIETSQSAQNIYESQLPEKIALLVGNERSGITTSILEHCSMQVYIPMFGITKSMNVTHALAVSLFEWIRQIHF